MNYWTKKFKHFNKKYWDGKLSNIKVFGSALDKRFAEGLYHFPDEEGEAYIELAKGLSHHYKTNILLHEMCHHAVEELYEERPYHDHGTLWKNEMKRVGFKGRIHSRRGGYKTREDHE